MDPATLEALSRASSLELFHLSNVIERLMSDPKRIVEIRRHLNLGKRVRFVDFKAPGAALQLRSGTVIALKATQVTVQDDSTRDAWTLPYAAIEIAAEHHDMPEPRTPKAPPRPTRQDFRVGDRVSFEDRHLQTRFGTITRVNQKTASVDCQDEFTWRVPFALLRHVIELPPETGDQRGAPVEIEWIPADHSSQVDK
jgi:hypothetical protein